MVLHGVLAAYLCHTRYLWGTPETGFYSGGVTWGDLPLHLAIIKSLLQGENKKLSGMFPLLRSPLFSGEIYPDSFFPHLQRAAMSLTGA
jgi:hypothetical protein